jgi:hypothetical protein
VQAALAQHLVLPIQAFQVLVQVLYSMELLLLVVDTVHIGTVLQVLL